MTRPSLAGSPPVACLLLLGCGAVVTGWYAGWAEDRIPWWLAVVAVVMALRTLTAVGNMRRYKAWAAQWRAMGGEDDAQQAGKKHGAGWVLAGLAIVLVVGIPAYLTQIKTTLAVAGYAEVNAVLPWLWAVAGLYLAGKLLWAALGYGQACGCGFEGTAPGTSRGGAGGMADRPRVFVAVAGCGDAESAGI